MAHDLKNKIVSEPEQTFRRDEIGKIKSAHRCKASKIKTEKKICCTSEAKSELKCFDLRYKWLSQKDNLISSDIFILQP